MPSKDIDIFLEAARVIFQGGNPYAIPGLEVFYPLPFYLLFVPLAVLPASVVHIIWMSLQGIILVAILRRRVIFAALSMPVLLTLLLGQVDIVMMALYALLRSGVAGGIALVYIVLKPQLALLLAPWMLWRWWRDDRRQIALFGFVLGVLVIGSFAIQPDWLVHFLARSGERTRAAISSSLWGLLSFLPSPLWLVCAALASLGAIVWAWRKNTFDSVAASGLLISPFIFSYNLTPLLIMIRKPIWLIGLSLLSWLTFGIAAWQSNDRASALLTVATLGMIVVEQRKTAK